MAKTVLITDSTAYIPQPLVDRYGILVAPQILIWGRETFRDGVDISPDQFYARLKTAKEMPSTSQVTPITLKEMMTPILAAGNSVLGIFISSDLSGTIASATQAKEAFPGAPVEMIDSRSTAMAMGFQVLAAARALEQGASLKEAAQVARKALENTGVMFVVDTLEFLHRGGRIGAATRYLGSALNLKPLLELRDGRVEPIERVRTKAKALDRMLELVEERVAKRSPLRLATIDAAARDEAEQLLKTAVARLHPVESMSTVASPVVGTHAGPGTVGLAYCAGV